MGMLVSPYRNSLATIDGTQGSINAGILAAVFFTVSGGTVTIVGQKNVSSITRHSAGKFRINFSSALANSNYGLVANARFSDFSTDNSALFAPNRNSTGGINTYSTSSVDLLCVAPDSSTAVDPLNGCVVIFDPSAVGSDYLAAGSFTVSGTTPTLQRQTNISGVPRQSVGIYRAGFTSSLAASDYSLFGSSRFPDFTNDWLAIFGPNRNTTGSLNTYSTAAIDLTGGRTGTTGSIGDYYEQARTSFLVRNSDVAPRGTVAAVRFTVSGGVCTVVRQWNVSSVTYQTTGCYRVNFTANIIDTDYGVLCGGRWADAAGVNDPPIIGPNRNSTNSRNLYSVSGVDLAVKNWDNVSFDAAYVDVWVVKPWLM